MQVLTSTKLVIATVVIRVAASTVIGTAGSAIGTAEVRIALRDVQAISTRQFSNGH